MPRISHALVLLPLLVALASLGCDDGPAAPETVQADNGSAGTTGAGAGGTGNSAGTAASGAGGVTNPGGQGTEAAYPDGPYGLSVGDVIRNLSFQGLTDPKQSNYETTTTQKISFSDYYNPTGDAAKPIALVITGAARWCGPCKTEASLSMGYWNFWKPKGVEFLSTIIEDENYQPSTFADLTAWASKYSLEYPVTIDPSPPQLGPYFADDAVPFNMVIDLRTMKILFKTASEVEFDQSNTVLQKATAAQ